MQRSPDTVASAQGARRLTRLPHIVLAAAVAALAVKLLLAATTDGTSDVRKFLAYLLQYRRDGAVFLYERAKEFNHPPPMLPVLDGVHWLSETTGLAFGFWLRLAGILADLGSLWIVAGLLAPALPSTRRQLVLLAAAPVSVMVSGFHGNTDPVMVFLVLVSIALLHRASPVWIAGIAMGMAVNVKIVPLVFWPAILLWLPSWRQRAAFFGAAVLVVLASWSPVLIAAPELVVRKVLGYGSSPGLWGISRILSSTGAPEWLGKLVLAAGLVALALWMNVGSARKPPLLRQLAVIAFGFLALAPGFGVQYLAWLVPFTALLPLAAAAIFHAVAGAFLFAMYTYWCQGDPRQVTDSNWLDPAFWSRGLPWDLARARPWGGELVILEIACWVTVVACLALHVRAAAAERSPALS